MNRVDLVDLDKSEKSRWTRIKNMTKESILNSTIHGLPSMVRTELRALKLSWLMCFLFSAAGGTYIVMLLFQAFLRFESVTNIETIHEIPSPFPAISTWIFAIWLNNNS
jgi:hypothetical protein